MWLWMCIIDSSLPILVSFVIPCASPVFSFDSLVLPRHDERQMREKSKSLHDGKKKTTVCGMPCWEKSAHMITLGVGSKHSTIKEECINLTMFLSMSTVDEILRRIQKQQCGWLVMKCKHVPQRCVVCLLSTIFVTALYSSDPCKPGTCLLAFAHLCPIFQKCTKKPSALVSSSMDTWWVSSGTSEY